MRLPDFEYVVPGTVAEAALLLSEPGLASAVVGGGTDLFPRMKRRQQVPTTLVSLSGIDEMRGIRLAGDTCVVGASTTLAELERSHLVPTALSAAAGQVASPQVRNTATVGGNLRLETRCNYADMPPTWREACGHCLKEGGDVCWVAPRGDRCWAVNSSDLAPVSIALGASVRLVGPGGERVLPVEDLYRDDGIAYHSMERGEVIVGLLVPDDPPRAAYRKLRRRGSIDFPLLGVAVSGRFDASGTCTEARVVIGAVAPAPIRAGEAEALLVGRHLTDDVVREAADAASHPVRPQDNTDTGSRYRKWMASVQAGRALEDLAQDGGREVGGEGGAEAGAEAGTEEAGDTSGREA